MQDLPLKNNFDENPFIAYHVNVVAVPLKSNDISNICFSY